MRAKPFVIITFLTLIGLFGLAQTAGWIDWWSDKPEKEYDAKDEFKKLYNKYNGSAGDFDITGTVFLFDIENNNALKEQASYRSGRSGNNLFTQLGCQRTYLVDNIVIQVDTSQKFIVVSPVNEELQKQTTSSAVPFELFINDTSGFTINATVTDNGAGRVLKLDGDAIPQVKTAFIHYNPADYSIQKAEIQWWKDQDVTKKSDEKKCWLSRITYSHGQAGTLNIPGEVAKILIIKGSDIVTTGEYKDYELVVNL